MTQTEPITRQEVLRRWPRLVAHMIAESLGYFTVCTAANAVAHYKSNQPFACEWYSDICRRQGKDMFEKEGLLAAGKLVLQAAIESRVRHRGYMADYLRARQLVEAERATHGATSNMLASWF